MGKLQQSKMFLVKQKLKKNMGKLQQSPKMFFVKQKVKKKRKIIRKLKKAVKTMFDGEEKFERVTRALEHITKKKKLKKNALFKEETVGPKMLAKNIGRKKKKNKKSHGNEPITHDGQLQEINPSLIHEASLVLSEVLESAPAYLDSSSSLQFSDIVSKIIELSESAYPFEAMDTPMSHYTPMMTSDVSEILLGSQKSSDHSLTAICKKNKNEMKIVRERSVEMHLVSNSKYIFLMKHPCSLFIRGKLRIKVIRGSVEVLGCTLTEGSGGETIYSPKGSSQLSLLTRPCEIHCENLHTKLVGLGMEIQDVESMVAGLGENDCLILAEEVSSALSSYINAQFGIQVFPNIKGLNDARYFYKAENHLQCRFELPVTRPKDKFYRKGPDWDILADIISSRSSTGFTSTVVCGGKGVGKSTLLRFLINRSLAVSDQVLCLDFDPGQAEFTVPGCLSAVIVKQPLLGPNYTHHKVPERMVYIGDVDVSRCPSIYIRCAHHIIDYCQSRPELMTMPWFINTMGFTKGLGVEFIVSLIRLLKPNHVVQIISRTVKRNFPNILDAPYIKAYQGSMNKDINTELNYSIHPSSSVAERMVQQGLKNEARWGFSPQQLREIMILSYFSQVVSPPSYSLADVVPYKTSLSKLKLCVCHESVHFSQLLSVMNGNLVALCATDDENDIIPENPEFPSVLLHLPISPCLGFGIVRGIDLEEKLLYMISPLSDSEMARVNCLVMGSVSLPERLYVAPLGVKGQIPYVVSGQCQQTARTPRPV